MERVSNQQRSKSQDSCRPITPEIVVYILDESRGVDSPDKKYSGSHRGEREERERRRNLGCSYVQSQNSSVKKDLVVYGDDDVYTGGESANSRTHSDRDNLYRRPSPDSETELLEDHRGHTSGGSMHVATPSQVESRAYEYVKPQYQNRSNYQLSQQYHSPYPHFRQNNLYTYPDECSQPLFQSPNTLHIRKPGERRRSSRAYDATSRQPYYSTTPPLASVRPGLVKNESFDFNSNRDEISHLNQRFVLIPRGVEQGVAQEEDSQRGQERVNGN
ncbi:hypothetical protein EYC80_007765 [Monilinia laxa]|uniref:Uncharacterized protein n=1 Tax=Monilinia laxa TaxID=61186 RepID=A0A5N6JX08_MONLA|nr:hypothetical protein EYC80_007765 [Monilinia laxa]